jgi:hypothetical protein
MSKFGKWATWIILALAITGCETTGRSVRDGDGVDNLAVLEALKQPEKGGIKVEVEANAGGNYHLGDPIRFKITSARKSRLWIITVNSENQAELLFPHGKDDENTLDANQEYLFPPRDSKQTLHADKPYGKTALAFIVTGKDTEWGDIVRLKNGNLRNVSFGSDTQWGVAKLTVNVER